MTKYTQLSISERCKIFERLKVNTSITNIAKELGRATSTISREIRRNSDHVGYLYPREAHERTKQRKYKLTQKVYRVKGLKDYIVEKLHKHWSPLAIAGRWTRDNPDYPIRAETIYRYIYSSKARSLELWKLLPRRKRKRGLVRKKRTSSTIASRVSIHERPAFINDRNNFGHYEADLFFNKGSASTNVLNCVERASRKIFLVKNSSKSSQAVLQALQESIGSLAQSITFDNGTEFAKHSELQKMGIPTFFCDPGSPWQKGSVENANGLIRRFIPFKLGHQEVTQDSLSQVAEIMNNTPRKSLDFLTPNEAFELFYQKNNSVALQI